MTKAMRKDFRMEIRRSKARFVSIFLIVALGVAFFSGVQATSPDMRYSGDAYFDEARLMDLRIRGTMGLTKEDVSAVQALPGVETAEGAWGVDVLCGKGETQGVLHVESLGESLNRLKVTEGRLPERSGEIFLDHAYASSQGYHPGDPITLIQDPDMELLTKETFTVTGTGSSPLYISFNRGNTTLGNGEVAGFAFVCPEDFDQEFYTQIYVGIHGADDAVAYTDAYDSLVDRITEEVKGISAERCEARYNEIRTEAEEELSDARKELEDGKKEAEEKLADARKEIEDGEKELETGTV